MDPARHRHFCASQAGDTHSQQLGSSCPLLKRQLNYFLAKLFLQPDTTLLFLLRILWESKNYIAAHHSSPYVSLIFAHSHMPAPKFLLLLTCAKPSTVLIALALRITSTK